MVPDEENGGWESLESLGWKKIMRDIREEERQRSTSLLTMIFGVVVQISTAALMAHFSSPSRQRLLVSILAFSLLGYICGVFSFLLENMLNAENMARVLGWIGVASGSLNTENMAEVLGWIGVASGSLSFLLFIVLCLPPNLGWIVVLPIGFVLVFLITMVIKGHLKPEQPTSEEGRPVATEPEPEPEPVATRAGATEEGGILTQEGDDTTEEVVTACF